MDENPTLVLLLRQWGVQGHGSAHVVPAGGFQVVPAGGSAQPSSITCLFDVTEVCSLITIGQLLTVPT